MSSTPCAPTFRRVLFLLVGVIASFPREAHPVGEPAAVSCGSQRARAEIEQVGAAMLAWLTDIITSSHLGGGIPGPLCVGEPPVDLALVPQIAIDDLRELLVPDYIAVVPENDPWNNPYEYRLDVENVYSPDVIAIRSAGSDASFDGPAYGFRFTTGPSEDLVYYNARWVRDLPRLDPVSRQQRSVQQILHTGLSILTWLTDIPLAGERSSSTPAREGATEVDLNDFAPITAAELRALIEPFYIRCIPVLDGWDAPYDYRLNDDYHGTHVLALRSLGSDSLPEGDLYPVAPFPAGERHHDIVWADGVTARAPDASDIEVFRDGFESAELWGYWSCGSGY
jgi:hypothetical protein